MRRKRSYRTTALQALDVRMVEAAISGTIVIAIDVAKEAMVFGLADRSGQVHVLVRFSHPRETQLFIALIDRWVAVGRPLEAAMEATGVYGDALRYQLERRGVPVFAVDPKRCHDIAIVLDGVPSQHDAKSCTLIAHLHAQGISRLWRTKTEHEVEARVLVKEHAIYATPLEAILGELEALTAAHWPELNALIDQRTSWFLHLLASYPSAAEVASNANDVRSLLRRRLPKERIEHVLQTAATTVGAPIAPVESQLIRILAKRALDLRAQLDDVEERIKKLGSKNAPTHRVAEVVGPAAACAILAYIGDPTRYASARALEKACGLNMRIRSSGKQVGQLHITKRGPSAIRKQLYLAAMRFVRGSPVARAWYEHRKAFIAGLKQKALVAVMRKLIKAIFHVARGAPFDASKLFDTARLAP